jgi:hypothetical protein
VKKVYRTPVEDYTGKKRTNYSYNDMVQLDVPKWHQVLNKVQNWLGYESKPNPYPDVYSDPRVIMNFKEKK